MFNNINKYSLLLTMLIFLASCQEIRKVEKKAEIITLEAIDEVIKEEVKDLEEEK